MKGEGIKSRYVVCIENGGYNASLEVRKIYRALPDESADKVGWIRVIDESEEDYLFPGKYFIPIELTEEIEQALYASAPLG